MNFKQKIADFIKDEEGVTIVEYAVAGALIAAGTVVAFGLLRDQVIAALGRMEAAVSSTT